MSAGRDDLQTFRVVAAEDPPQSGRTPSDIAIDLPAGSLPSSRSKMAAPNRAAVGAVAASAGRRR
jgi:hypothetical protein